ncbi:glucokinase [Sulfitobacter sp. F26204]|uniref:glucokinase n=1 Tax=Sulfitobacter sp. F26204 TaxID=2996014 RepID=UPI00225E682D|nr:glucokinase [Sulfitobacter sp. F26204]MCX7560607.1 glucokinase [Sulfitobacter sp. F26204]
MTPGAKTLLLADVGGTNTRVAVAENGTAANVRHYRNADFGSFYSLIRKYVDSLKLPQIEECCVAMAGPVRGGEGRLTNRDWHIATTQIQTEFGCSKALLMNDLTALGHALPRLPKESLNALAGPIGAVSNGQSLVVGIGTGFNLCPVQHQRNGTVACLEVEMGHAALPVPLKVALKDVIGKAADGFATLEHLFSGGGLASFHQARKEEAKSAKDIVEAYLAGDQAAENTLTLYSELLGILSNELAYYYMPMNGVYFAGSVARGVLRPEFHANLTKSDANAGKVGNLNHAIPKAIVLDDAAALIGCLAALDQVELL